MTPSLALGLDLSNILGIRGISPAPPIVNNPIKNEDNVTIKNEDGTEILNG